MPILCFRISCSVSSLDIAMLLGSPAQGAHCHWEIPPADQQKGMVWQVGDELLMHFLLYLFFHCRLISSYLVHHGYCASSESFNLATGQEASESISSIKSRQRMSAWIFAAVLNSMAVLMYVVHFLFYRYPKTGFGGSSHWCNSDCAPATSRVVGQESTATVHAQMSTVYRDGGRSGWRSSFGVIGVSELA